MPAYTPPWFMGNHFDIMYIDIPSSDVMKSPLTVPQAIFPRTTCNNVHVLAQHYGYPPPLGTRLARDLCAPLGPTSAIILVMVDLEIVLRYHAFRGDLPVLGGQLRAPLAPTRPTKCWNSELGAFGAWMENAP